MQSKQKAVSMNPFTGETLSEKEYLSENEITKKIQTSWDAFMSWRKTDTSTRRDMLSKLADTFEKNMDKLAKTITMETGKTIMQSRREVEKSVKLIRYYSKSAEEFLKCDETKIENAKKSYVRYEPLGPIYHMSSYNYPLYQNMRRGIPALLMGNTVLSRCSHLTPQTGCLIEDLFRESGFSKGEFLNLLIPQERSEMIISSSHVRGVSYIGSMSGGLEMGSLAGKHSKKFVSELGSNDSFIVMKDADLEWATDRAIESRLKSSGQSGIAAKSFLLEDSIFDSFRDKLIEKLRKVKMGDPMDESTMLGPLTTKEDLQKSNDQIKRAKDEGAKLLYGGESMKEEKLKKGLFFMPTVLEVSEKSLLLQEETFAPIFALTRFKSDEDIIRLTNSKRFGFSSAIFTKDESKAEKLASELDVGSVFINTRSHFQVGMPMGGVKCSGVGRDGGIWGTREFSNVKAVFISDTTSSSKKMSLECK